MIHNAQIFNSKFLIVDDEPANVKLIEQLIKELGCTSTQSTTDSREVVEQNQEFLPDLIILDLRMPHLDGV